VLKGVRKEMPIKPPKREVPKTVYNRKKKCDFGWAGVYPEEY
jgi:hypothetical protein